MLRTLRLQNYRCFGDHTVNLHSPTVIVGKNNAGKSTIVEALHIIASITNRRAATFVVPPKTADLNRSHRYIAPKIAHLNLALETAFHRYGPPPAVLTATFTGGGTITAYVHREGVHAVARGAKGTITTNAAWAALDLPYIHILPQVAPLQPKEVRLTDEHIAENYYTRLGSRHFRNQIHGSQENFALFKQLAESTWPGLRLEPVYDNGTNLTLLVTDGDFVAEVAWMGHGLQMWLQTMWFIAKTPVTSTVVLDEPDVYMHPDLQRRLYRLVSARFAQAIIATHSVEIMAEADPSNILVVNNKNARSEYANTEPAVQELVDHLGGIHNVHLARLWNAKRVIMVEGDDLGFLKTFHATLFPDSQTPLDAVPNWSIGGWGGWTHAIGGSMAYKNAFGDQITRYCIFDSDYHTSEQKDDRYQQAADRAINIHIWQRKEIENYLLDAKVIARLIKKRTRETPPTAEEITSFLDTACEEEKDNVIDGIADSIVATDRKYQTGAHKLARERLAKRWENEKQHLVSGKALLTKLNQWSTLRFKASVGAMAIARAFREDEMPDDLRTIITNIEEGTPFPNQATQAGPVPQ